MKFEIALLTLITLSGIALFHVDTPMNYNIEMKGSEVQMYQRYAQWKTKYNKNSNGSEDQFRFSIFQQNAKEIDQFNQENKNNNILLETNFFSDLTEEEIRTHFNGINTNDEELKKQEAYAFQNPRTRSVDVNSLPRSVNWNDKGKVGPVVNQGYCGGCWAFATVGSLEGLNAIQNGEFQSLSQQQLISCAPKPSFNGCEGSRYPFWPFKYTQANGMMSYQDYPFVQGPEGKQEPIQCKYDEKDVVFRHKSHEFLFGTNSDELLEAVSQQPVAISINAHAKAFHNYAKGVIPNKDCSGYTITHAILLVGYNLDAEVPYYIVKNSWGASWGDNGYAKLEISSTRFGTCGINRFAGRPL